MIRQYLQDTSCKAETKLYDRISLYSYITGLRGLQQANTRQADLRGMNHSGWESAAPDSIMSALASAPRP